VAYRVFQYLNVDKAAEYRAVMQSFVEAKARFALHLRPSDVRTALADHPEAQCELDVDSLLRQLCDWGNLASHPDTADVSTVEEFFTPRHLYQLTAEGEAAERAILHFEESLKRPGELQTTALDDIRSLLRELEPLAAAEAPDEAKIHRALSQLVNRFEELTSRAHTFIGSLQRAIDLHSFPFEEFLNYKQKLIEYLERFVGELTRATVEIVDRLAALERCGTDRFLQIAAVRDLSDALVVDEAETASRLELWRSRWQGLRAWFIRHENAPSQADVLRDRARMAIRALLSVIASLNDRRSNRSDRVQDLRTLAHWFLQSKSDRDAHRLWRAAFALAPSRHLQVNEDTIDSRDAQPVAASTSWLDAPPIEIAPRLRRVGRSTPRGPAKAIVDRSQEKALLAATMSEEARQLRAARERLATGRTTRLSELGYLARAEFSLFLDLLDEALTKRSSTTAAIETTSSDGTLAIRLWPANGRFRIETDDGELSGLDCFILICDALAADGGDLRNVSHYGHESTVLAGAE
jgi:uncharacterized protein (TIGR02677 family)